MPPSEQQRLLDHVGLPRLVHVVHARAVGREVGQQQVHLRVRGRGIGDSGRAARPQRSLPLGPGRLGRLLLRVQRSQEAKALSCGTPTDGALNTQVDWRAAQQLAHRRLGLVRGEVALQKARARHLHAPWSLIMPTQRL